MLCNDKYKRIKIKGGNITFIRYTKPCGCIYDVNCFGARRYIQRCKEHPIKPIKSFWVLKRK